MKLTRREAEAVMRLSGNEEWKTFCGAIVREAEDLNEKLIMAEHLTLDLNTLRGMTREITLVLKAISTAPNVLKATQEK